MLTSEKLIGEFNDKNPCKEKSRGDRLPVYVDATGLANPRSGTGRVTFGLLNELALFEGLEVYSLCRTPDIARNVPKGNTIVETSSVISRVPALIWSKFFLRGLIKASRFIFISPIAVLPRSLGPHGTSIIFVNDFVHIIDPNSVLTGTRLFYKKFLVADIIRATAVVAISAGTSEKILCYSGRRADLIINPPCQFLFPARSNGRALKEKYFLFVGTVEPRKNLENTVKAFVTTQAQGNLTNFKFIIAGKKGWRAEGVVREIMHAPNVVWVENVCEKQLAELYSDAFAVVLMSNYEGYGITAAEAQIFGTRLLATDIPEIREAAKGRGVFVKNDVCSIIGGLLSVAQSASPTPEADHRFNEGVNKLVDSLASYHRV